MCVLQYEASDSGTAIAIDKHVRRFNTTGVPVSLSTTQQTASEHKAEDQEHGHLHLEQDSGLFLIGLFKLAKAIFFLGVSLGSLHFIHHSLSSTVDRIFRELHFDPESHVVDLIMDKVGQVTHHKLRLISMGTSLYAALCTAEAYGLLRRKVWAEFVTLWLSVSFVPWELYEMTRRPTTWHLSILLANLVIVAYLLWLLRRKKAKQRQAWSAPQPVNQDSKHQM